MFIILVAGYVLGKIGVIDRVASKNLSKLIVMIGQPALIIHAIIGHRYSENNLKLAITSFIIALIVHLLLALFAFLSCIKIKDLNERKITEFAMIFGNIGFLGIPVISALLPKDGAFVAAFFIVCFNILLWIIGLGIIARQRNDIRLTVKQMFLNKGTIPSFIGFAIFLIPAIFPSFELPTFASQSIDYIASLCTPISMLIIGALIATRPLKTLFNSGKIYYLSFIKLILIPLFFCFVAKILGFSDFWIIFITTISAMPCASATSMFAELYDTAPEYSAQCVGTSTLFSLLTMPLLLYIANMILQLDFQLFNIGI